MPLLPAARRALTLPRAEQPQPPTADAALLHRLRTTPWGESGRRRRVRRDQCNSSATGPGEVGPTGAVYAPSSRGLCHSTVRGQQQKPSVRALRARAALCALPRNPSARSKARTRRTHSALPRVAAEISGKGTERGRGLLALSAEGANSAGAA